MTYHIIANLVDVMISVISMVTAAVAVGSATCDLMVLFAGVMVSVILCVCQT